MVTDTREQAARDRAVAQLKKRRDFRGHLLVYVLVNAFLVAIWAVTGAPGFFWPVFPIVGWGIGVVMKRLSRVPLNFGGGPVDDQAAFCS